MLQYTLHHRLADLDTPVGLYLRLRDHYPEVLLFEHADAGQGIAGKSFICCEPLAEFRYASGTLSRRYPDGTAKSEAGRSAGEIPDLLRHFVTEAGLPPLPGYPEVSSVFGYFNFDAVECFEDLRFRAVADPTREIPGVRFSLYRFVLVFDHRRNSLDLFECFDPEAGPSLTESFLQKIAARPVHVFPFQCTGAETSAVSDEECLEMMRKGIAHCKRGDVFQIVLSRSFRQPFTGDEFNVYRTLRSINPSPYLFYLDYGDYRLLGSSPEAQLQIRDGKATLHPIAGTYRRSGDQRKDAEAAVSLLEDPKENAEHVMLVDLARNDLSKSYKSVSVPVFRQVREFSHVIHLVSVVDAEHALDGVDAIAVLGDTFPAGTLSGAPKYRAMQLIDQYEPHRRGFYGGCVGMIGRDGSCNLAIMIRTFLSRDSYLHYQAGAGVVAHSKPENEMQEIFNKIAALRTAIEKAQTL